MMKRLRIFAGEEHPYRGQIKTASQQEQEV
jgi:ribosomal protein L13